MCYFILRSNTMFYLFIHYDRKWYVRGQSGLLHPTPHLSLSITAVIIVSTICNNFLNLYIENG